MLPECWTWLLDGTTEPEKTKQFAQFDLTRIAPKIMQHKIRTTNDLFNVRSAICPKRMSTRMRLGMMMMMMMTMIGGPEKFTAHFAVTFARYGFVITCSNLFRGQERKGRTGGDITTFANNLWPFDCCWPSEGCYHFVTATATVCFYGLNI